MSNTDKRISAKWKLCIIVICAVSIALYLTVKLTGHILKNDTQGWTEGGDTRKLYVQREGKARVYTSTDDAVTWSGDEKPDFYMRIPEEKLTDSVVSIPIEIVNDSDSYLTVGSAFLLYLWSDGEWSPTEVNYQSHEDLACSIQSHASFEMTCGLYNIRLEAGKYLITKIVTCDNDKSVWTLGAEFIVE